MLRLTLKVLGHYVWILDKLQFTHTIQHRHILREFGIRIA